MDKQQEIFTKILREAVKDEVQPLREEITTFTNEILTGQDKIVGQLKTIREEQAAFTGGQERQDDKLEEHDKRLEQVEVKIGIEPITTYDGDG